ncbi:hypothetical protein [uncultured Paraglaciecola sp.]|uniref:hypothetical protein n=1 Tax=uncultured Paraglaciecola sp. TaxID=1765024 RepID=UPI0030D92B0D|tara:strand:+ start:5948 stop:6292 length:345 start_codon:yes stop_codon:yes gene_type:complete
MNKIKFKKYDILKTITLTSILLLTSTHSLAELNLEEKVYTQKGYPYEGLVARSEQVTIFYTKDTNNVSCRVEVSQEGEIWRGEVRKSSIKHFTQKPLRACLNRVDAKKLLADTF